MKWSEAKALFLSACSNASAASAEAQIHLAEGIRWVCSQTDFQGQDDVDVEKFTTPGVDFVSLPDNVNNLITVVNKTTGYKLSAEPNGLRGRTLYFEPDTGKPAQGEPTFWVRASDRLYLRGTPDDIYTLRLVYKEDPAVPDDTSMNVEIPIPDDYHMGVVYAAAVNFLAVHPEVSKQIEGGIQTMMGMRDQSVQIMQPKEAEKFDRRDRFYLRSFRLSGKM